MKKPLIAFIVLCLLIIIVHAAKTTRVDEYSHPIISEIKYRLGLIAPEYAKIPIKVGDKSYTEDKSVITLCIVDPNTNRYYDTNTLMYVVLHEVSHVVTKASGAKSHQDEFKSNFSSLLKAAALRGVYNPQQPIVENYCGT